MREPEYRHINRDRAYDVRRDNRFRENRSFEGRYLESVNCEDMRQREKSARSQKESAQRSRVYLEDSTNPRKNRGAARSDVHTRGDGVRVRHIEGGRSKKSGQMQEGIPHTRARRARGKGTRKAPAIGSAKGFSMIKRARSRQIFAILCLVAFALIVAGVIKLCSSDASTGQASASGSTTLANHSNSTSPDHQHSNQQQAQLSREQERKELMSMTPLSHSTSYEVISTATYPYDKTYDGGAEFPEKELRYVLEHAKEYPDALLSNLSLNPEMLHFAYLYPALVGKDPAQSIGTPALSHNNIPHLLQFDTRWGAMPYGEFPLAVSGCGPTTLSMVVAGLTNNYEVTPAVVAKYAEKHGFYTEAGSDWTLMSEGAKAFGLTGRQINNVTESSIVTSLKKGHPVICAMKPGDFTILGHFIVLCGMPQEGLVWVCDPNSIRRTKSMWTLKQVLPQIKAAWSMSAGAQ